MHTLLLLGILAAAAGPESGPQVGSRLPGPFEPLNLNGPDEGEEACLFCRYGNDPVVMVFARSHSDGLARLVRELEKSAEANKDRSLGACVVYLDTSDRLKADARRLAGDAKLKHVILSCIAPAAVADYQIAAGADVTVLVYRNRTVRANHSFKSGELTEAAVGRVLADLPKALDEK